MPRNQGADLLRLLHRDVVLEPSSEAMLHVCLGQKDVVTALGGGLRWPRRSKQVDRTPGASLTRTGLRKAEQADRQRPRYARVRDRRGYARPAAHPVSELGGVGEQASSASSAPREAAGIAASASREGLPRCLMATKMRQMRDHVGNIEYFCTYLDANQWDSAKTKTAFSTFSGAALLLRDGRLTLIIPQGRKRPDFPVSAAVSDIRLEYPALSKLQNTAVVINFGTGPRWMVNFGKVWDRQRVHKGDGQINYVKAFLVPRLGLKSIREGRSMRQEFIDAVTTAGGQLTL